MFSTPRFYLEPNLNQKQIRIQMQVNGQDERMVMDYERFYKARAGCIGGVPNCMRARAESSDGGLGSGAKYMRDS